MKLDLYGILSTIRIQSFTNANEREGLLHPNLNVKLNDSFRLLSKSQNHIRGCILSLVVSKALEQLYRIIYFERSL
jgi:hypothetical protein